MDHISLRTFQYSNRSFNSMFLIDSLLFTQEVCFNYNKKHTTNQKEYHKRTTVSSTSIKQT